MTPEDPSKPFIQVPADTRLRTAKLVDRFAEQADLNVRSECNETALRRDFMDPFLKALGWGAANEEGRAEEYRRVVH